MLIHSWIFIYYGISTVAEQVRLRAASGARRRRAPRLRGVIWRHGSRLDNRLAEALRTIDFVAKPETRASGFAAWPRGRDLNFRFVVLCPRDFPLSNLKRS